MFLKKRTTRLVAALLAFLLAFGSAFAFLDAVFKMSLDDSYRSDIFLLEGYSHRTMEMCQAAWLYYNMDSIVENAEDPEKRELLKKSVQTELQRAGLADGTGKFISPVGSPFSYSLTSGGNTLFKSTEQLPDENRYLLETLVREDGCFITNEPEYNSDVWINNNSVRCYTNTKGMYYFYYKGQGIAVYDYDTAGLEWFTDDLGAKIYLNPDGTSPVPHIYNDSEYSGYKSFDEAGPLEKHEMYMTNPENAVLKIAPFQNDIDAFEAYLVQNNNSEAQSVSRTMTAMLLLGLSGILALYLVVMSGYNDQTEKFEMRIPDRIYGEILVGIGIILPFLCVLIGADIFVDSVYRFSRINVNEMSVIIPCSTGLAFLYMMVVCSVASVVNRFKCHEVTNTFAGLLAVKKVYRGVRNRTGKFWMLRDDVFTKRFVIRLVQALLAGAAAVVIGLITENLFILAVCCILVIVFYLIESLRDFRELNKLCAQITAISRGVYTAVPEDQTSIIYGMTSRLNSISDGIQTAVDEQIRSERMKIELVTNVSHDLKTPLTSVISYVDLLSKEELPPEARDYVTVLEQKTTRLKTIVSDVFDLAKATTGTDVNFETIDAVILVNQVLADMEDRIAESGREIKLAVNAETAFIDAEGKKMYRVLQNIFDNALKYSLEGTRIFARLDAADGNVIITVKNTSSYEMNFTPEEITERFTRGDKARTTEGSGLGLSIARSFTEACGGKFDIVLDGDVFTAGVEFRMKQSTLISADLHGDD